MKSGKKGLSFLAWPLTILLQLILTQVVTFLFSTLIPGMENYPDTRPVFFVAVAGISFSVGVFLGGFLAIRQRWLAIPPKYPVRFVAALIGAYVPLIVALFLYHPIGIGNPFFLVAIIASILGFYVPGWMARK